jgi:hypothetical protein
LLVTKPFIPVIQAYSMKWGGIKRERTGEEPKEKGQWMQESELD